MILGVIPARYASTRFPGKPLVDILGKPMIQHVYERCVQAHSLADVVVATDDERIASAVNRFGGKVVMTRSDHLSGTERVGEVAEKWPDFSHYVNIQGDEPLIDPRQIDQLGALLHGSDQAKIATLARTIQSASFLQSPNAVKVVLDHKGNALYFSRAPIPYVRDKEALDKWIKKGVFLKHVGIYGFERNALLAVSQMKPSYLEETESLEQLRWLANGYPIRVGKTEFESPAVDSPEDLVMVIELIKAKEKR